LDSPFAANHSLWSEPHRLGLAAMLALVLWVIPLNNNTHAQEPPVHVVQPGETLQQIAAVYGVNAYDLARYNGLRNLAAVQTDQCLRIPTATALTPTRQPKIHLPQVTSARDIPTPTPYPWQVFPSFYPEQPYTVKQGDSLRSIAAHHGVSISALWERNRLKTPTLVEGQLLMIPAR
jgi:LysM repeat protein